MARCRPPGCGESEEVEGEGVPGPDQLLTVGVEVEVYGLQGTKALNGCRGRIVEVLPERFGVLLDGHAEPKAVRGVNLRLVDEEPCFDDVLRRLAGCTEARGAESGQQPWSARGGVSASKLLAACLREHGPKGSCAEHFAGRGQLPAAPPRLPERPGAPSSREPAAFADEGEYPDLALARLTAKAVGVAGACGFAASLCGWLPGTWLVWSFLFVHLLGATLLADTAEPGGLVALVAGLALHAGASLAELLCWVASGETSVGPWSLVVLGSCTLYVHNFWSECLHLPPDYITGISLFFPMFPAYCCAIVFSAVELFLEWRYLPQYKVWPSAVGVGAVLMICGQLLMAASCWTADRNYWATCRQPPEEEDVDGEDLIGLEVPDRRIVQENVFSWERHPSYLGAMLWGIGVEVALCNPLMFLVVGFMLWASLLYVALEEEQELYEEFKGDYANYAALTPCWIPYFDSVLASSAFSREMQERAEEEAQAQDDAGDGAGEPDNEGDGEDGESEDETLPTWQGVPKGGALWNRQFREPWVLG